ncbi:MAG TPA: bifunctional 5,10-methylenetetrahydrofolate dehydrogenase/5,10-methenyltetrahydrofolate cyclohydrolase [Roseiflexaceae bacterium]|nr:bifunctional 5,10-methylenetetrahydrofolate dehydrogenase/5,10-methenyltetrahydrofolate cyclohydrolase [Roseiflexaceae bacterium]
MSHKHIGGKTVADPILEDVRRRVLALKGCGWTPRLASIEVGDVPAASIYVRNQRRTCEKVGIEFDHRQYAGDITQAEMLAAINALNADPRVTGIILQRPVPSHLSLKEIQVAIHPSKDVEGMNPFNIGKVVYGDKGLGPCTSLASVELLRSTGLDLPGLEVVVVGHSELVGKPLALYLLQELATVTICHHGTRNLSHHTRRAEALFVAVGKPGLITGDMVKPGAVVIDIGINQIDVTDADGTVRKKTVGDVDYESVHEVAGWITPVPGGVGPVTLSILMRNTVLSLEYAKEQYEKIMRA